MMERTAVGMVGKQLRYDELTAEPEGLTAGPQGVAIEPW